MKKRDILLLFVFLIIIVLLILFLTSLPKGTISGEAVKEPYSEIQVYFCPADMCKEKLNYLIDSSKEIKCAFYELNLFDMIEKLNSKNAEIVIEDSTYENGSGFYTGFSNALMHNKFCVFDSRIISTGSMNPTVNDNFLNNNNLVIIQSETLAKNYLDEFNELKNNVYGKGDKIKNSEVYIGDTKIENYFCPEDNCKLHVINALKKANKSVYFMVFSFTDEDIGNLLWNKNYQGLDVKGIFDESQLSDYSRYEDLKDFSIIDKNKYKLHDKVFIIDNETVITGSYNPSKNANEFNDENILIIHNKKVAEKYVNEFFNLYNFKSEIPKKTQELVVLKILYDPDGADEGNEKVWITNLENDQINLEYYSISDNKTSMRLNGLLSKGETADIKPKFSLKNTNGILILKHNTEIIDFVAWEGVWKISAKEGDILIRKEFSTVSEGAWE